MRRIAIASVVLLGLSACGGEKEAAEGAVFKGAKVTLPEGLTLGTDGRISGSVESSTPVMFDLSEIDMPTADTFPRWVSEQAAMTAERYPGETWNHSRVGDLDVMSGSYTDANGKLERVESYLPTAAGKAIKCRMWSKEAKPGLLAVCRSLRKQ